MKRFYKTVQAGGEGAILLDGKPVRTPARQALILPSRALAAAVAAEWDAQTDDIDPRSMPLTGIANAAIDRVTPDPAAFVAPLAAYAETDLLCYRADDQPDLAERQARDWNPVLDWASERYGVDFVVVEGVIFRPQPAETIARLHDALLAFDPFRLAALNPLITIGGSLVIALAVADQAMTADAAFDCAHLDELWQASLWGEDAMAVAARTRRHEEFATAARFIDLLD